MSSRIVSSDILWYSWRSLTRRFGSNRAIYLCIGCAGMFVFSVTCLREMSMREIQEHFVQVSGGGDLSLLTRIVSWLGIAVSFLEAQLLLERAARDHFLEFGVLVNIGVPRGIVALVASTEYLGFVLVGGCVGITGGLVGIAMASLSASFVRPTIQQMGLASVYALGVPCAAVIPVGASLFYRLLAAREGTARAR